MNTPNSDCYLIIIAVATYIVFKIYTKQRLRALFLKAMNPVLINTDEGYCWEIDWGTTTFTIRDIMESSNFYEQEFMIGRQQNKWVWKLAKTNQMTKGQERHKTVDDKLQWTTIEDPKIEMFINMNYDAYNGTRIAFLSA